MTTAEIKMLAYEAAGAAFDAHGDDMPAADDAYDFVRTMRYDGEIDAEMIELDKSELAMFRLYYAERTEQLILGTAETRAN